MLYNIKLTLLVTFLKVLEENCDKKTTRVRSFTLVERSPSDFRIYISSDPVTKIW